LFSFQELHAPDEGKKCNSRSENQCRAQEEKKSMEREKGRGDVLWLTFLLRQQRLRRGASAAIAAAAEAQEEGEQQEEADAGGGTH
jgi:hypothetical protein